jgi:hypothetical protein
MEAAQPQVRFEDVASAVRLLVNRLRAEVKAAERPTAEVATALGLSESALTNLLADPPRLDVRQLFGILESIGLHPADFFVRLRPQKHGKYLPNMKVLAEAASAMPLNVDPLGELSGPNEARRLTTLLQAKITAAKKSLRALSTELGFRPDHLSQILRGSVELKVWQVYALLRCLGIQPADFFDELYGLVDGLPDWHLPGDRRWSELRLLAQHLEAELAVIEADPSWQEADTAVAPTASSASDWTGERQAWDLASLERAEATGTHTAKKPVEPEG